VSRASDVRWSEEVRSDTSRVGSRLRGDGSEGFILVGIDESVSGTLVRGVDDVNDDGIVI
jgi:hypothetical protein